MRPDNIPGTERSPRPCSELHLWEHPYPFGPPFGLPLGPLGLPRPASVPPQSTKTSPKKHATQQRRHMIMPQSVLKSPGEGIQPGVLLSLLQSGSKTITKMASKVSRHRFWVTGCSSEVISPSTFSSFNRCARLNTNIPEDTCDAGY